MKKAKTEVRPDGQSWIGSGVETLGEASSREGGARPPSRAADRRKALAYCSTGFLAAASFFAVQPGRVGATGVAAGANAGAPGSRAIVRSGDVRLVSAREGAEYRLLRVAAPLESTDRIDVLAFFWFGCPHCHTLEPALKAWAAKLAPDTAFRKVHVPWRDQLQQFYYTLEALGKPALTDKVFVAIHQAKVSLQTVQQMAEWITRHGVAEKNFMEAFESFGVRTRMRRAAQLAEGYRLEGVPAIGVGGRFLTAPSMAGSNAQALEVADQLIEMERRARRGPKS
jgi:thiol:disulfide interchange protein DsbA